MGEDRALDHVALATGREHQLLKPGKLSLADFNNTLEVKWGVRFVVRAPRQRTCSTAA